MFNRLQRSFDLHSDRNVFCINKKYYTYREFSCLVSSVSNFIQHNKFEKEKLFGLVVTNDIETYAAIFALWFGGCGFVPVNPSNPAERNLAVIKQSQIKTIFSLLPLQDIDLNFNSVSIRHFVLSDLPKYEAKFDVFVDDMNDVAYLFHTSGSTGVPKGVPISFNNLNAFIDSFFDLGLSINEQDRFLQMFELTFDLSVFSYLVPLCVGACVYPVGPSTIKYMSVFKILDEEEISVALMVPSIISFLRPYFKDIKLNNLRYNLFCGEALHLDVLIEWMNCVPYSEIHNVYGPTENTIFCTDYLVPDNNNKIKSYNGIVSIGKCLKHVQALIVDHDFNLLGSNQKGELAISGDLLTQGYWNDSELTDKTFFQMNGNRYYHSGDTVFMDDTGYIFFCGRKDQQIKIQGFRVELSEIEFLVKKNYPEIHDVSAISYVNPLGNTQIQLFVKNFNDEPSDILEYLKTQIPLYMIPTGVTNLKSFPLNINGKIDRIALLKEWLEG